MKLSLFPILLIFPVLCFAQSEHITPKSMFERLYPRWQEVLIQPRTFFGYFNAEDFEIEEIGVVRMERTRCYGACPAYDVSISKTREVLYTGVANVEKIGSYRGNITNSRDLNRLRLYIKKINYFNMQSMFRPLVTDSATVYTEVALGNSRVKAIMNYANGGPVELWGLEQLIDHIIEGVEWQEN